MAALEEVRRLVARKRYAELKERLAGLELPDLAGSWRRLDPMERLVAFKLMAPRRALEFYALLDFDSRYFLLSAADPGSIAPVLEGLAEGERAAFQVLPAPLRDRMLRELVSDVPEFHLSPQTN